jgi:hypothetical protein
MFPEEMPKPGDFMTILKEIPEYFDFLQKIFGGAIADITKDFDVILINTIKAAGGLPNISASASIGITVPVPNLNVPLMSIAKQIEDVLIKINLIKKLILQKAKEILNKIKKLEGVSLYLNLPEEFLLILFVLIEAEFIYANLPIVMDKILNYFINLFVKKFTELVRPIIDSIFDVVEKIKEIVPPVEDLLQLFWAIPNNGDLCVNLALNIALPNMWGII